MDFIGKILLGVSVGAFSIGGWVGILQYTVSAHSIEIKETRSELQEQKEKYLDVLARIDERLKNIENKR